MVHASGLPEPGRMTIGASGLDGNMAGRRSGVCSRPSTAMTIVTARGDANELPADMTAFTARSLMLSCKRKAREVMVKGCIGLRISTRSA